VKLIGLVPVFFYRFKYLFGSLLFILGSLLLRGHRHRACEHDDGRDESHQQKSF